jgi:hypothetical protein
MFSISMMKQLAKISVQKKGSGSVMHKKAALGGFY